MFNQVEPIEIKISFARVTWVCHETCFWWSGNHNTYRKPTQTWGEDRLHRERPFCRVWGLNPDQSANLKVMNPFSGKLDIKNQ